MTPECHLKISDNCCLKMKKEPVHKWEKENNRYVAMTGMRKEEGGMRTQLGCILTDKNGQLKKFHPLLVVNDEWEDWFIKEHHIELSPIYNKPYCFKRTGCKCCPFSLDLQHQLDVLEELMPDEYKQAETIWKPVFDEYRRIGYRLRKKDTYKQLSLLEEENNE